MNIKEIVFFYCFSLKGYFNKLFGILGSSTNHAKQALVPALADNEPIQFNNPANIFLPPNLIFFQLNDK